MTFITTLHCKNKDADSILTLESGDPRMHQDVYSQYVFQEPSKACRLHEPAHNIRDQIYHQKPNKASQATYSTGTCELLFPNFPT